MKPLWYPKKLLHVVGEQKMQGAEDDDSWMRDGAAELERELAARQAEMDPSASEKQPGTSFDPEDLAERMKVSFEAHLTSWTWTSNTLTLSCYTCLFSLPHASKNTSSPNLLCIIPQM